MHAYGHSLLAAMRAYVAAPTAVGAGRSCGPTYALALPQREELLRVLRVLRRNARGHPLGLHGAPLIHFRITDYLRAFRYTAWMSAT